MSSFYDDASLVVIPSGYKTSKIYAEKPTDGSGDLTFTRASGATRVGPNGLIEKVRTNLVLQSQTFENASWLKYNATATANTTTAPDGTTTADTLTDNATNDIHITYQSLSLTAGENTISVYAKANTLSHASIYIYDGANFFSSGIFNLSNGTVSGAGSIISAGNGWYRVSFTATIASGSGNVYIALSNGSTISYAGTGQSIYVWGYQVETGVATAYIPTTTAAVSVGPVSGLPRLDYLNSTCPRLLLEPQRTNLATWSEQANAYTKANATIGSNVVASPDGYTNADSLIEDTTNGAHAFFNFGLTTFSAQSYTASVFAKKGSRDWFALQMYWNTNVLAYFNLNTGVVGTVTAGATATITPYGNGWYRCTITATAEANAGGIAIYAANGNNSISYAGTNGLTAGYFYGWQLEAGAYATSYIPTLGASVTRVADAASKTGISSLIGQTEGTLFADFVYSGKFGSASNSSMPISIDDASGNNEAYIFINGTNNVASGQFVVGGGFTCNISGLALTVGTRYKIAFAYKQNDFALYINGALQGVDTSGNIAALPNLRIGNYFGLNYIQDTVNQALLFKTRLTNAQLAELTTL
jgi:hypothetical protein